MFIFSKETVRKQKPELRRVASAFLGCSACVSKVRKLDFSMYLHVCLLQFSSIGILGNQSIPVRCVETCLFEELILTGDD